MKYLKLASLLFATAVLFATCAKNKIEIFGVKDFSHSECKNSSQKSFLFEPETITLKTVNANKLKIIHSNAIFACCPNGKLKAEASFTNDTILLNEYATDLTCDCLCPYDLKYTIGKLDYGKYIVNMQIMKSDYFTFNINFNSNTDTTIIIKK